MTSIERNVWKFPRPIRNINPLKISALLAVLNEIGVGQTFMSDQGLQDDMTKALKSAGYVRGASEVIDKKSGGPRTYIALLEALGLVFQRDRTLWFTIAGESLLDSKSPMSILRRQILRLQYPSPYSMGHGVRLSMEFKIRPFLFLLELLDQPEIEGTISDIEIAVAIASAKQRSASAIADVVKRILAIRSGAELTDVLSDLNLATPRKPNANDQAFLVDIANTFSNVLRAGGLVHEVPGTKPLQFSAAFPFSTAEIQSVSEEPLIDADLSEEQFQRRYGRGDRRKDTRLFTESKNAGDWRKGAIFAKFQEISTTSFSSASPGTLAEEISISLGVPKDLVVETIKPYVARTGDLFCDNYRFLSCSGSSRALEFEKATCQVFNQLGFQTLHTGQKSRTGLGGYSDLFLVAADNVNCGVADCKASPRYDLPHKDILAMQETYIPAARTELATQQQKVSFCLYIASGFITSISSRTTELESRIKVPVTAISAEELISELIASKDGDQERMNSAHENLLARLLKRR